ncbi:MAG: hypothetical protein AMJ62_12025 [Myxococcales bacterium SG8_38]|nr:MAG: hypothetical protein AMJ62_12025 [Myxococcales bacterium SG8_38]
MTSSSYMRQRVLMAVGFALSGIALYYFLGRVDGRQLLSALASADLWILSVCVVTKGMVLSLNATRTRVLLLPLRRYRFFECFVPWLSAFVTDNLFPFRLGELVRIDLLARAGGISRSSTAAVVGLDRLLDLVSLLVLLAVAAPVLTFDLASAGRLILVGTIVALCVATVIWLATHPAAISRLVATLARPMNAGSQEWLIEKAQQFSQGLGGLRSWKMVLTVLTLTLVARALGMLAIQCWLWAFDLSLPPYTSLVVLLFISIGTMIPSSPGFIGTFHVACAYALELMGATPEIAASVAVAGHFMTTVPWTIGGLFVSFSGIRRAWQQRRDSIRPVERVASA